MPKGTARPPPMDLDAERAVLGSMLLEGEAAGLAIERLVPEDFYRAAHRDIFKALCSICDRGEAPDQLILRDYLEERHCLEDIGGADYLHELAVAVPSAANIERYAKIVWERSLARKLINASTATLREARDGGIIEDLLRRAQARMSEVTTEASNSEPVTLKEIMGEAYAALADRRQHPAEITGLPTGLWKLDDITSGLQPSDSIILAARTSIGKTSLALSIMQNMLSEDPPRRILLFTLEMSKKVVAERLLSMRSQVPFKKLKTGMVSDDDWQRVDDVITELTGLPLFIDATPGISLAQIRMKARRMRDLKGIEFIVIDYVQLITAPSAKTREREVALISGGLKELAADMGIPILFLAQLRRPADDRRDARPKLSDLRESGALEQDADVVMLLHRETHVDGTGSPKATLYIAKQRNGETGSIALDFRGPFMQYVSGEKATAPVEDRESESEPIGQMGLPKGDR